jgi:hypothetical protein
MLPLAGPQPERDAVPPPKTRYKIRGQCPRCHARYLVGVDHFGTYQIHCPDCNEWVAITLQKENECEKSSTTS